MNPQTPIDARPHADAADVPAAPRRDDDDDRAYAAIADPVLADPDPDVDATADAVADAAADDDGDRREIVPLVLAIVALVAAVGIMATSGGCRSSKPAAANDPIFAPDGGRAALDAFLDAQAARGARDDAMLYSHHFDEAQLNALGRAKLDLMLRAPDAPLPLVVYLNLRPDDDLAGPRRETLSHHLLALGLLDSQFRIEPGQNPATQHPLAPTLAAEHPDPLPAPDASTPTSLPR